ncbi:MAG TPA: tetratricopeptide repeat protein [Bacteroidota bacterium]|nr:tetratricopeptide repeat protein [Bacteroidota bacterium]
MNDERIQKLRSMLEQDPNDSFTRYALALEYAGAADSTQALSLFEDLLHRDPSYVPVYQQLGYLYEKLGRTSDAASMFKRGMQIAAEQGDEHARSEMQDALENLET